MICTSAASDCAPPRLPRAIVLSYALKQMFRSFFEQKSVPEALGFLDNWLNEVERSDLPKMKQVANTLAEHFAGLLDAIKWKLTNAYAESTNASIEELKTVARGFQNLNPSGRPSSSF